MEKIKFQFNNDIQLHSFNDQPLYFFIDHFFSKKKKKLLQQNLITIGMLI